MLEKIFGITIPEYFILIAFGLAILINILGFYYYFKNKPISK
jgi:hypothetical protein